MATKKEKENLFPKIWIQDWNEESQEVGVSQNYPCHRNHPEIYKKNINLFLKVHPFL
jgi:hypothetical protein